MLDFLVESVIMVSAEACARISQEAEGGWCTKALR